MTNKSPTKSYMTKEKWIKKNVNDSMGSCIFFALLISFLVTSISFGCGLLFLGLLESIGLVFIIGPISLFFSYFLSYAILESIVKKEAKTMKFLEE